MALARHYGRYSLSGLDALSPGAARQVAAEMAQIIDQMHRSRAALSAQALVAPDLPSRQAMLNELESVQAEVDKLDRARSDVLADRMAPGAWGAEAARISERLYMGKDLKGSTVADSLKQMSKDMLSRIETAMKYAGPLGPVVIAGAIGVAIWYWYRRKKAKRLRVA